MKLLHSKGIRGFKVGKRWSAFIMRGHSGRYSVWLNTPHILKQWTVPTKRELKFDTIEFFRRLPKFFCFPFYVRISQCDCDLFWTHTRHRFLCYWTFKRAFNAMRANAEGPCSWSQISRANFIAHRNETWIEF